ncbi:MULTISPECIES: S8 family serine peptidase [unclassified Pseudoalteromonas]|uniref:S8 family serine peptidase n=1 Tax=unclassified Pseudoalteromonas TaxID=194690 RepID=UPI0025B4F4D9|nr:MULTISPECIES: S8 family serine peptidase [unclassified Pseudoalteromonas]MDN3380743.1 S8 family serine peptidase [Pseudoalteromonas sp. APC 3893]MDN3389129.1 S8 family serine peptidase [Pseudoalteromonas sp. APC 4017]
MNMKTVRVKHIIAASLCIFSATSSANIVQVDQVLGQLNPIEQRIEQTIERAQRLPLPVPVPQISIDELKAQISEPISNLPNVLNINIDSQNTAFVEVELENGFRAIERQWLLMANSQQLNTLKQQNITIVSVKNYNALNMSLVRFNTPQGVNSKNELLKALNLDESAILDRNHIYQAQTGEPALKVTQKKSIAPYCTQSVKIGMIDSAINTKHSAFKGANIITQSFLPKGLSSPNLHGTAIAGLITGKGANLSPLLSSAKLYSAEVFYRQSDYAQGATLFAIVEALNWLVSNKIPVINMSLTGPNNAVLEASITAAIKQNVLIIAAAGNQGPASQPLYPGAYKSVIAVSAIDSKNQIYRWSNKGDYIDFTAFGVNVVTSQGNGKFGRESGTSMAAPHVSAALSCLLLKHDNNKTKALTELTSLAIDLGEQGKDTTFGYGAIYPPKRAL